MTRAIRILTLLICAAAASRCTTPSADAPTGSSKPRVLLAVFAHPDDETSVTPVLARYAAEGVKVYLAIASDGRYGVTEHAHIPAGDSLAAKRVSELECAAQQLGIEPPIRFGLHDQFKMQGGFGPVHDQLAEMRTQVTRLFEELKPDAVITWPASGWSGHHDHRLVHAVVTEVYESKDWGSHPANLFYPGIPAGKLPDAAGPFAVMDSTWLTVKVTASKENYEQAAQALYCHESQYTREQMDGMRGMISSALGDVTWFRPHHGAPKGLFND